MLAITPFNFTSIAGNLPTAPALMGNIVVWKPSPTQQLSAHYLMRLLEAAGLPPGVINLVTGDGAAVSRVALTAPDLAGIHFTGSTGTFQHLWRTVGENIAGYRSYPRLVGETGGKDFVIAHPSADPAVLATALVRGAFEYQGQKCSAASRAYVARSVWDRMGDDFVAQAAGAARWATCPPTSRTSWARSSTTGRSPSTPPRWPGPSRTPVGDRADRRRGATTRTGTSSSRPCWPAPTRPTRCSPPSTSARSWPCTSTTTRDYDEVRGPGRRTCRPYALTGAIIAQDRAAIAAATETLRFAAGNFYINDKPTGAVVGQQPFGGARASGTNDKAGSMLNLIRWASAADHQGDVRAAGRLPLPAHGLSLPALRADGGTLALPCTAFLAGPFGL